MARRKVYTLRFDASQRRWLLFDDEGWGRMSWPIRSSAISGSARWIRKLAAEGERIELQVHRLDGTIGETRTYPRKSDPRRSKG